MRLAAPWYVHPSEDPDAWGRLIDGSDLAFAVVNASDGPGDTPDPAYTDVLSGGSATPLLGYVDLDYGGVPSSRVLSQAEAWRGWYGVHGLFLDRVPSGGDTGSWSTALVDRLRGDGASFVALNPGTMPRTETLLAADATCVFEGTRRDHLQTPPERITVPTAVWHLVFGCPKPLQRRMIQRAEGAGADLVWVTDGRPPNPWNRLPRNW